MHKTLTSFGFWSIPNKPLKQSKMNVHFLTWCVGVSVRCGYKKRVSQNVWLITKKIIQSFHPVHWNIKNVKFLLTFWIWHFWAHFGHYLGILWAFLISFFGIEFRVPTTCTLERTNILSFFMVDLLKKNTLRNLIIFLSFLLIFEYRSLLWNFYEKSFQIKTSPSKSELLYKLFDTHHLYFLNQSLVKHMWLVFSKQFFTVTNFICHQRKMNWYMMYQT